MKIRILLILSLTMLTFFKDAQSQSVDSLNMVTAQRVLESNFQNSLDQSHFLLYGLEGQYIVVFKNDKGYDLHFVDKEDGIKETVHYKKRNKTMKMAFNPESYHKPFHYSNETREDPSSMKVIYLLLKENGEKKCEISVPVYLGHGVENKAPFPIHTDVQTFLYNKVAERLN